MRNGWDSVRAEVERELEVEEIKRAAREAAAQAEAAQTGFKDSVQQVRQPVDEAVSALKTAATPEPAAAESGPEAQQELPLGEPVAAPAAKETAHGGH